MTVDLQMKLFKQVLYTVNIKQHLKAITVLRFQFLDQVLLGHEINIKR